MNPAAIIEQAKGDGVTLSLSPAGSVKMTGDEKAVARWLPAIRENKALLVVLLSGGNAADDAIPAPALPAWCKADCPSLEEIPGVGVGCVLPIPGGGEEWRLLAMMTECPKIRMAAEAKSRTWKAGRMEPCHLCGDLTGWRTRSRPTCPCCR